MRKTNKRRISILVNSQTAHNLQKLAVMSGTYDMGTVVDKLTRDRMVALHQISREYKEGV